MPSDLLPRPIPGPLPVELPLDLEAPVGLVRRPRSARRVGMRLLAGFVAFLVLGNLGIFVAMLVAKAAAPDTPAVPAVVAATINNAEIVDDHLWRGGAPADSGYAALAGQGVTTVIDLRAEDDVVIDEGLLSSLGIERIAMPIRDGQVPSPALVAQFLAAVDSSEGRVFVHCGAGVGRTGALVAAYLVEEHGSTGLGAMRANLEVGPPSFEQLAFAAGLEQGEAVERPNPLLTGLSRVLDAPRRIWKQVEG